MNDIVEIIRRIEENINQEIDYNNLCKGLGVTSNSLQRVFPVLFNITLSEYIRKRRLTKAAFELQQTQHRVLDIALKYGYETNEAFSTAFKKQHGTTPSAVRKGACFKLYDVLEVDLTIKGGKEIPIEIITLPDFYIAGLSIKTSVNSPEISFLWEKLTSSDLVDELISVSTGRSFGVCYDIKNNEKIKYIAGWEIESPEKVEHLPVDVTLVESATFAIIPCIGEVPESLYNAWSYMWNKFFPESGYNYTGKVDLEYYPEKVTNDNNYQMQIWIPIEKASI